MPTVSTALRPRIDRCLIFPAAPTLAGRQSWAPRPWAPMPVRDVTHERFKEWFLGYLSHARGLGIVWPQLETSADEREALLEQLEQWGVPPLMFRE